MTDLNNVNIIGRMTRDIDDSSFRYTPNGTACLKLSLAVNRSAKKDGQWTDEVSYIDVTVWGKQAESIKQYLGKGKQVAVSGYLKQDRWEKEGHKQSKVGIVADSVQLLGGKEPAYPQNNAAKGSADDFWNDGNF